MPTKQLRELIECTSLCAVLEVLADIAAAKEDDYVHNWQDRATARAWGRAVSILERAASQIEV
jgi:hypothetical protein